MLECNSMVLFNAIKQCRHNAAINNYPINYEKLNVQTALARHKVLNNNYIRKLRFVWLLE